MIVVSGDDLDTLIEMHRAGVIAQRKGLTVSAANCRLLDYLINVLKSCGNSGFKEIIMTAGIEQITYLHSMASYENEIILSSLFGRLLIEMGVTK